MRQDSKSVSLITQHHMYLSFLAINFCSSSRTMTAVPCTGIFTTLNLSRVAWWRDESSIPLSETKPAWQINPQEPWWLTALCTVWWINTAREQAGAELANCSLCCPSGTVILFDFQTAWKLTAATMQIAAFPHIHYIFTPYSAMFVNRNREFSFIPRLIFEANGRERVFAILNPKHLLISKHPTQDSSPGTTLTHQTPKIIFFLQL